MHHENYNASTADHTYIIASCKAWHKPLVEKISKTNPGTWIYVTNTNELESALSTSTPRYIFFLHWNWIVSENIWGAHECICFHMTDVPYGRGGSPLQNLILAGHNETKLTALRMVDCVDAGPVYTKQPLQLSGTAQEIYVAAGIVSGKIIEWMIKQNPVPFEQVGDVVLFKRRKPEQSVLPVSGSLTSTYDFIRMLDADGYPLAFIEHGDFILSFSNARIKNGRLLAETEIKLKT